MKKGNLINGARTIMTLGSLAYLGAMIVTEVKDSIEHKRLMKSVDMIKEFDFDTAESNPNVIHIVERNLGEVDL